MLFCAAGPLTYCQTLSTTVPPSGKAIFKRHCASCHGETGGGIAGVVTIAGPSLQAEHDFGNVMTAIETGPSHMPVFSRVLSVSEIRSVAGYVTNKIAVIPLNGGNISEGGKLFSIYCAACHRTAVRGGALAFTDVNAPDLSHKSAALIAGAIRWGPGPMPGFTQDVLSNQQLDSIVIYLKFAQHPPTPGGNPISWEGPVPEGLFGFFGVFAIIAMCFWIEKGGKG
jgi:ubiquinol-cytochrome c reductase cytochrome c subunit